MSKALIVATYNIEYSRRPQQITKTILRMARRGVSVICLQEMLRIPQQAFIGDVLLDVLGESWELVYFIGKKGNYLDEGVGILWNTKDVSLQSTNRVSLPELKNPKRYERFFLRALGYQEDLLPRRTIIATFLFHTYSVRVTSLHLDLVGGIAHRKYQTKYLLDYVQKKQPVDSEIICGDFNTIDFLSTGKEEHSLTQLFSSYSLCDVTSAIRWSADMSQTAFGEKQTILTRIIKWFPIHARRKLDYIWSDCTHVKKVDSKKIDSDASDHNPIITKFSFF
jgi:endonuclease/exonuclease/phosphatase family metal-dependent hydrolase